MADSFLDLLYGEAPRAAFDRVLAHAQVDGLSGDELAAKETKATSLRHDRVVRDAHR